MEKEKLIPDTELVNLFDELNNSFNSSLVAIRKLKKNEKVRSNPAWEIMMKWERKIEGMNDSVDDFLERHKNVK